MQRRRNFILAVPTVVALFLLLAVAPVSAQIVLNGGTHTETVGSTSNVLNAYSFNVIGSNGDNRLDQIGNFGSIGLTSDSPFSHILIDGTNIIRYDNDNDFRVGDPFPSKGFQTSLLSLPGLNQNDDFATMFRGQLNVPDLLGGGLPYTVEFGTNRADDPVQVYVDLNQNGLFEAAGGGGFNGERVVDRACCGNQFNNFVLAPGTYNYMAVQLERGGGSAVEPTIDLNATGRVTVSPGTQGGLFTVNNATNAGANVTATGLGNQIDIPDTIDHVNYGSLTFGAGASDLFVNSSYQGAVVTFAGAALSGSGDTLIANRSSTIVSGPISGSGGLSFDGTDGGRLVLPQASTFTGVLDITDGTVTIHNGNALGASAGGAADQTVVNAGSSLRIMGGMNINETLRINGGGSAISDGALHSIGGNVDYNGPITLDGNATIRKEGGGDLEIRGGIDTAGNEVRFETLDTVRVLGGGSSITGGGSVLKEDTGTLEFHNNNTYSGATTINNGVVDIRTNDGLGTTAGGTNIDGDATLRLRGNINSAEPITLNGTAGGGTGQGNQGRIRNDDNNNTLSGTIGWNTNSNVNVDAGTQLTLSGVISGGGDINKQDTGRLDINNAANTFSGAVNIGGGTAGFTNPGSLGAASSISVASGATLEVNNVGTIASPVNIAGDGDGGVGAINNVAGTTNFTGPLSITGTTISGAAGTNTTFTGPVSLGATTNVTFNSDGEMTVSQAFGNGNGNVKSAGLHFLGSEGAPRDTAVPQLNFDNNGGLMNGAAPTLTANGWDVDLAALEAHPDHRIRTLLTSGPGNRGLDFDNDGDFPVTAIVGNDDYNSLFIGTLTVSPADAGTWGFRREQGDDRESIWIDLDQDGVFELTGAFGDPGGGNNQRGEMLTFENSTEKTVTLAAGDYLFAVNHTEFGGGSQIDVNVRTPNLAQETINPTDPDQAGFWSVIEAANNSVVKNGAGILRFDGDNTYNGTTDVNAGTLIINGTTSGQGDFNIASGATLGGNGEIGLQPGASVIISEFPGTLSPGDAGSGSNPTFSGGIDPTTIGSLFFNQPDGGLALDLGGTLQLEIFSESLFDSIEAIAGSIQLGANSKLSINGQEDFSLIDFGALGIETGVDDLLLIATADGLTGEFMNVPLADGQFDFEDAAGNQLSFIQDGNNLFLSAAAVPEPTTIAIWSLLGLMVGGFAWRRARRSR